MRKKYNFFNTSEKSKNFAQAANSCAIPQAFGTIIGLFIVFNRLNFHPHKFTCSCGLMNLKSKTPLNNRYYTCTFRILPSCQQPSPTLALHHSNSCTRSLQLLRWIVPTLALDSCRSCAGVLQRQRYIRSTLAPDHLHIAATAGLALPQTRRL